MSYQQNILLYSLKIKKISKNKVHYKKLVTVIAFGLSLSFSYAQNIDNTKLDAYFKVLGDNNRFMGSVAIVKDGKSLYSKAIGYADIQTGIKANEETKYRIGSISKTFTAVLIFKAIEENKLSLEHTIYEYFPTIKNSNKITIAQLLSHRSGIHDFIHDEKYTQWNTTKKTADELVDMITKAGSDFEPDSRAAYSNSNFVLLSIILQKVYKKEYATILNERIIQPLALKNTFYGRTINLKDNESNSYQFITNWEKETETDTSIPLGAGAIVSTSSDLTKFASGLFGGRLVSAESLTQMETIKDNYGMGLVEFRYDDQIGFSHSGSIDGFVALYAYFPTDKVSVAFTSNGLNYDQDGIIQTLLSSVYQKPFEVPDFAIIEVSDQDLNRYPGNYFCKEINVKIAITKKDKILMLLMNGRASFTLDAKAKDKFKAEKMGAVLEFDLPKQQIILKRGGGTYIFKKE